MAATALRDIFIEFGMEVDMGRTWLPLTSNFIWRKSKMAAAAILKIHF